MLKQMKKRFLWLITVFVCAAILVAGLWPFRFNPQNKVKWLGHENGIWFYGKGFVQSEEGFALADGMSIEMWLRPGHNREDATSRILTLYDGDYEDFIVEQWKSTLIARNVSRGPDGSEIQRVTGVEYVPTAGRARFVTITSGTGGVSIYLDGRPASMNPSWFPEYAGAQQHLLLGNSPAGKSPWKGDLLGLALYNRTLSSEEVSRSFIAWEEKGQPPFPGKEGPAAMYLFDERAGHVIRNRLGPRQQLDMPSRFRPPNRVVLAPPWKDFRMRRSYFRDIALNIAGFVPFGFLVGALLLRTSSLSRRNAVILTVFFGLGLSLFIELVQVCLPERSSQLSDVISNTLGTALGVTLLTRLRR